MITATAGGVTKQIPITIKIATTEIVLNSDYRIMKPGDTFQLVSNVQPEGAPAGMTYKSLNSDVATVSGTGNIAAKKSGNTAIIVSNGDLQVAVTVIVNENGGAVEEKEEVQQGNLGQETEISEIVSVTDYPVLTSEILKYLYENKKKIIITSEDYTIYLNGDDIVNTDNELYTELVFWRMKMDFLFVSIMVKNYAEK